MPPTEFEPAIPESEWPQTHALEGAVTGILNFPVSRTQTDGGSLKAEMCACSWVLYH
jgi:hypothetical protein